MEEAQEALPWREETRPVGRSCLSRAHKLRRALTGFVPVCEVVGDFGSVYGGVTDQMDDPLLVGTLVGHLWFGT